MYFIIIFTYKHESSDGKFSSYAKKQNFSLSLQVEVNEKVIKI